MASDVSSDKGLYKKRSLGIFLVLCFGASSIVCTYFLFAKKKTGTVSYHIIELKPDLYSLPEVIDLLEHRGVAMMCDVDFDQLLTIPPANLNQSAYTLADLLNHSLAGTSIGYRLLGHDVELYDKNATRILRWMLVDERCKPLPGVCVRVKNKFYNKKFACSDNFGAITLAVNPQTDSVLDFEYDRMRFELPITNAPNSNSSLLMVGNTKQGNISFSFALYIPPCNK